MTLPVRPPATRRRGLTLGTPAPILSAVRLAAALVLMLVAGIFYWLTSAPTFSLDPAKVDLTGFHYTDPAVALAAMGLGPDARPNLFRIDTGAMASALRGLPAVQSADVAVRLPDQLDVSITERVPIMIWQHGATRLLSDIDGDLFAPATDADALPAIDDQRGGEADPAPGATLAPLDLEVARTLSAITPADLGSDATTLSLSVTDSDGWVLAAPAGWRAVFGFYTPDLRPPSMIDGQVQCLAALLAAGESSVASVTLALNETDCGTYLPRPSPSASPQPTRERSPSPTKRP